MCGEYISWVPYLSFKEKNSVTFICMILNWMWLGKFLVEVKFKFLPNISHYYNNIFAFHKYMFTIFVLSLNKLNTTIHSHIRFIIIAYSQNMHFRIHCKKLLKQKNNSFHHNLTLQKIHTKVKHRIHYRSLCLFVLLRTSIQITR